MGFHPVAETSCGGKHLEPDFVGGAATGGMSSCECNKAQAITPLKPMVLILRTIPAFKTCCEKRAPVARPQPFFISSVCSSENCHPMVSATALSEK